MLQVKLQDGRVFPGRVEDVDHESDLATVRINCSGLPVAKLGTSKDLRPGEWVIAMGSPLGYSNTVTTGVVSNIARQVLDMSILWTPLTTTLVGARPSWASGATYLSISRRTR